MAKNPGLLEKLFAAITDDNVALNVALSHIRTHLCGDHKGIFCTSDINLRRSVVECVQLRVN